LDFVKQILAFAFSQVGVVVLCVLYAVGGANVYLSMEVPFEEEAYMAKQTEAKVLMPPDSSAQAIIDATDYLANSFWDKIHNPNPDKRLNETAYYDKVPGLQPQDRPPGQLGPAQPRGADSQRSGEPQL
jgi:hypothetical protein